MSSKIKRKESDEALNNKKQTKVFINTYGTAFLEPHFYLF